MASSVDLEIGLFRRDEDNYGIEMRFSREDTETDTRLLGGKTPLSFDLTALRAHADDGAEYGRLLGRAFFVEAVRTAFSRARAQAAELNTPLRVRLLINAGSPELHALRWETMRDPEGDYPLFCGERILFSRYLSSSDWRLLKLRARTELKALLVFANPVDLPDYGLEPLDVDAEMARAVSGLGGVDESPALGNVVVGQVSRGISLQVVTVRDVPGQVGEGQLLCFHDVVEVFG